MACRFSILLSTKVLKTLDSRCRLLISSFALFSARSWYCKTLSILSTLILAVLDLISSRYLSLSKGVMLLRFLFSWSSFWKSFWGPVENRFFLLFYRSTSSRNFLNFFRRLSAPFTSSPSSEPSFVFIAGKLKLFTQLKSSHFYFIILVGRAFSF